MLGIYRFISAANEKPETWGSLARSLEAGALSCLRFYVSDWEIAPKGDPQGEGHEVMSNKQVHRRANAKLAEEQVTMQRRSR